MGQSSERYAVFLALLALTLLGCPGESPSDPGIDDLGTAIDRPHTPPKDGSGPDSADMATRDQATDATRDQGTDASRDQRADTTRDQGADLEADQSIVTPPPGTKLGVIRWDGWTAGNTYPYCGIAPLEDPCYVTSWEEWALHKENGKYYDRIPFYSVPSGTDPDYYIKATGVPGEQTTIDREIAYAKEAGIDYFAYVYYPDSNPLARARLLHAKSAQRNDVKMAFINWNLADPAATCAVFAESYYQKVLGTRPLLYTYGLEQWLNATYVTNLRNACAAAGVGDPFIVEMNWDSATATTEATAMGMDAISNYTVFAGTSDEPYQNMAARGVGVWNAHAATGLKVIPFVGVGWDPRPRYGESEHYSTKATADEVASQIFNGLHWTQTQASAAAADTVIVYAWNEFSEGGWLCPLYTGATPDKSRLTAIKSMRDKQPAKIASAALAATASASGIYQNSQDFVASKATDSDFATAWQCNTNSNCWLELDFNGPKVVDKVVIAEYGERISGYKIQRWDGSGFQDHYLGHAVDTKYIGKIRYLDIPQTTTSRLRLYITSATHTPIIYEFQAYDAT